MRIKYPWKISKSIKLIRKDKEGKLVVIIRHYSNSSRKRAIKLILGEAVDIARLT